MKFGVPRKAKGIRPEARETAEEAARRAGMSLDDWLSAVIMQQAVQAGVPPHGPQAAAQPDRRELATVNKRLDELSRRIEQFARAGAPAYPPQRQQQSRGPDQRAELIDRLDQYLHNARPPAPQAAQPARRVPPEPGPLRPPPLPLALDRALSEIAARQQVLNGGAPPAPQRHPPESSPAAYAPPAARAQRAAPAPASAPLPTQDLSGLEKQLRKITSQIETLRQPGVEQAINALRSELGAIGHALGEAMPWHAIQSIEHQIQGLSERIADGRQNGADKSALLSIEHGLTEVRDALRGLTPAEKLVGFNDAITGLAQKIDLIVAQRDPTTMAQLESAITTLRDMANRVASSDAVSALAAQVQALTDKVDHIAQSRTNADALTSLEHRIDALGQALAKQAQNGDAAPPRLEALVQSLSDKIEQIQHAQQTGGFMTEGHVLDDRIAMLVERLDASDSRIGQMEAIERGLSDLLAQIEQSQLARDPAAPTSEAMAIDALKSDLAQAQEVLKYDISRAQDALKNDLVHSQFEIKDDIARTQGALNQVHGTLDELINRLATIEQSFRNEARVPAPPSAFAQVHEQPVYQEVHQEHQEHQEQELQEGEHEVEEPLELIGLAGGVAAQFVDDAPGMAAFDDVPPPHTAQPAEPEFIAPLMQPVPMAEPEPAAIEEEEPPEASLPSAPQLQVPLDALRTKIAALPASSQQSWAPDAPAPKRKGADHRPIDRDLPPDQPLEPGSGRPPRHTNPAARIAASEAALGHAQSAQETSALGSKSSFIAAARRAAQAAMQQEGSAAAAPEFADEREHSDGQPIRKRVIRQVKSLFIAASVVAIVVGSVQIATNKFHLGKWGALTRTTQQHISTRQRADSAPAEPAARNVREAANPMATTQPPSAVAPTPLALVPPGASINLLAPPDETVQIVTVPTPAPHRTAQAAGQKAKGAAATDITGSIPKAAADHSTRLPPVAALDHSGLPVAIGSPHLRQAAAAGNSAAAYEVAMRFAEGRGVPADLTNAAHWYERAASKGLAPAQFRLASLLEKGRGVKKDLPRARALYFSAARQGNAKAMHNLAVLYAEGIDGKPDYATAVQWFSTAAKHGVSDSQYNLGILYARGIGVDKSLPESYKWFALAAEQGDKEAVKKRDEVASHMNAKELAAARHMVAKFVPAPQPHRATSVPAPPGGWDKAAAAPATSVTVQTADAFAVGKQ